VDAQGEVIIVESGSYAGGTITKAVKVNAAPGVVAFSGLPIVVDPGAGNLVVIRGLTIKAATPGIGSGLTLNSGQLSVEDSVIDGWQFGIFLTAAQHLHVGNSVVRNMSTTAIYSTGSAHTSVENTRFLNMGVGPSGGAAYDGLGSSTASFSGCEVSGGYGGIWSRVGTQVFVDNCRINNVSAALYPEGLIRVSRTIVTKCVIGVQGGGGTIESFGNNVIRGNTTDLNNVMLTPIAMQ
jgi:hypothetical protein